MHARPRTLALLSALVVSLAAAAASAALSESLRSELEKAKYVYVSSTRESGSLSKPAEIWFLLHDGAVYVASPPDTWRAKRIRAGKTRAKIAVGKPDGPSFYATGKIVDEPAVHDVLFATFAKKYADGWPQFESKFRSGLKDGSRVLIRYTPE